MGPKQLNSSYSTESYKVAMMHCIISFQETQKTIDLVTNLKMLSIENYYLILDLSGITRGWHSNTLNCDLGQNFDQKNYHGIALILRLCPGVLSLKFCLTLTNLTIYIKEI